MNMKFLIAFVDAFKSHESCMGRKYVEETTARTLAEAYAALPAEVSEHIPFDGVAEAAYDDARRLADRQPKGEVRELFTQAAKLLAIPFADSIVRLANPPEPANMATDGADADDISDAVIRAVTTETGEHTAAAE